MKKYTFIIILIVLMVIAIAITIIWIVRNDKKVTVDQNKPLNLLFVGDSYTVSNSSYADQIQKYIPNSTITKVAKVGEQTGWMLSNSINKLQSGNYDVVFILGGLNDIYATNQDENAKSNLQQMYSLAHNAGSKVVGITIAPTDYYDLYDSNKGFLTDDLNQWIRRNNAVDYVLDLHEILSKNGKQDLELFVSDKLHPTSIAQDVLAQRAVKTVFA